MADALRTITERVRARLERDGVDLAADRAAAQRYAREAVRRYNEERLAGAGELIGDEQALVRDAVASLTGFGPLQPLLDDPSIEEIWLNAPDAVWVARAGVAQQVRLDLTDRQVRDLVERMLQSSGRRVDLSTPFVDASLPDGSRLHVVVPDVTRAHYAVNIRKFSRGIRRLDDLVRLGSLPESAAALIGDAVGAGATVLVSGATQAGKTTLLAALLAAVADRERIVTVEETFELAVPGRDVVALQCRQASLEGTGEVTLRRLVKEALRMRPDRLVVGEVREAEALDLLIALNAGLPGMCSIHANSAADALRKLSLLPLLAGRNIDAAFVVPTVSHAVDLVVHCELRADGSRRVAEIGRPVPRGDVGEIGVELLYRADAVATDAAPARVESIRAVG